VTEQMTNGAKPGRTSAKNRRTSTTLKILLAITALLVFLFIAFDIQPAHEITGLLFFALLF